MKNPPIWVKHFAANCYLIVEKGENFALAELLLNYTSQIFKVIENRFYKGRKLNLIKKIFTILFTVLLFGTTGAQSISNVGVFDPYTDPGLNIVELKPPPSKTIGNSSLFKDWKKGNAFLNTKHKLEGYYLNFDLFNNMLEIKSEETIKVCNLNLLEKFEVYSPYLEQQISYINANKVVPADGVPFIGILEVLVNDKAMLVRKPSVWLKDPYYVPALNAGSRDAEIIKKEEYYLVIEGVAYELSNRRNKSVPQFKDHEKEVMAYVKENKLSFRNESDMIEIVKYYNSLI